MDEHSSEVFPRAQPLAERCRLMENSRGWIAGRQGRVRQEEQSIFFIT